MPAEAEAAAAAQFGFPRIWNKFYSVTISEKSKHPFTWQKYEASDKERKNEFFYIWWGDSTICHARGMTTSKFFCISQPLGYLISEASARRCQTMIKEQLFAKPSIWLSSSNSSSMNAVSWRHKCTLVSFYDHLYLGQTIQR